MTQKQKTMSELLSEYFDAVVALENLDESDFEYPEALARYQAISEEYTARIIANNKAKEAEQKKASARPSLEADRVGSYFEPML